MNDTWLEIACEVPSDLADILADYLSGVTDGGVCMENIEVDTFSLDEIRHSPITTVKAYVTAGCDIEGLLAGTAAFIERLSAQHGGTVVAKPSVSQVQSEDWSSSWKSNFKPLRVGRRLLIVPSWEEAASRDGDIILRLDPGMAFGTGGHETTRLCLELLERVMDEMPDSFSPLVLDVGTGSGILAMAAVHLGAARVCALDIDPQAIEVAQENVASNGLAERIECSTMPLESVDGVFNVVLANILAEELVRLAPHLSRCLAPGGFLILSGILAEKEDLVVTGFLPQGLEYCETLHDGEWVAILYRNRLTSQ